MAYVSFSLTRWQHSTLLCNFSSIFTRFRDIAAFVLQHTAFAHPTSSLPHVPLEISGWPLGYKVQRCWDNCMWK